MARHHQLRFVRNDTLFGICQQFMDGKGATDIEEWLKTQHEEELDRLEKEHGLVLKRESFYPLLREAIRRGYLFLRPPEEQALAENIRHRYGLDDKDVKVIDVRGRTAPVEVAHAAAELILELIKKLAADEAKKEVHIGLGAGYTTLAVARHLAALLRAEPHYPNLVLHASTSGFEVERPLSSPVAFFSLFDQTKVKSIGLFAPAIIFPHEYVTLKERPGILESFRHAGEIDIVVMSLAQATDPHGLLNRFLGVVEKREGPADADGPQPPAEMHQVLAKMRQDLEAANWVGDVAFLPYSSAGPITLDTGIRAMTLFELPDLVTLAAAPGKHVVLVAAPCGTCFRSKSRALVPLLRKETPSLHVWNHLLTDITTARELLTPAPPLSILPSHNPIS